MDIYIDFHAHNNLLGACIYGIREDDVFHMERHALFPKLLSQIADDFYIDNTVYCKEPLRSGSSRRWMKTFYVIIWFMLCFYSYVASIFHNKVNCYTLEVSYYGYYDKATLGHTIIPYTQRKCILYSKVVRYYQNFFKIIIEFSKKRKKINY